MHVGLAIQGNALGWNHTAATPGCASGPCCRLLDPIGSGKSEKPHKREDRTEKYQTGRDGAPSHAACDHRFCEKVTDGGTQRSRQDIGHPEGEDRIHFEKPVRRDNGTNYRCKSQRSRTIPKGKLFGQQITHRCAHSKGEQDSRPIK